MWLIFSSQLLYRVGIFSDNILLAQKLNQGHDRESGPTRCAYMVDNFKAFGSLHWDFVLVVPHKINFPSIFTDRVKICLYTPHFFIKLNGISHGYFLGAKGFR